MTKVALRRLRLGAAHSLRDLLVKGVYMTRKLKYLVPLLAVMAFVASAAQSGAAGKGGELPNPMVSPNLPGIELGYYTPNFTKPAWPNHSEYDITNARTAGLPWMKVRLYLKGVTIRKIYAGNPANTQGRLVKGGVLWTLHRVPAGTGYGVFVDTKTIAKRGAKLCDRVTITLSNGKTASYALPCALVK